MQQSYHAMIKCVLPFIISYLKSLFALCIGKVTFLKYFIRPANVSQEGLKFHPGTFFLFLSIHSAQQPSSGWPEVRSQVKLQQLA